METERPPQPHFKSEKSMVLWNKRKIKFILFLSTKIVKNKIRGSSISFSEKGKTTP
jgi:hypothetical protein